MTGKRLRVADFLLTIQSEGRALMQRAVISAGGKPNGVSPDEVMSSFMAQYDEMAETYGVSDEGLRQDALEIFEKAVFARLGQ